MSIRARITAWFDYVAPLDPSWAEEPVAGHTITEHNTRTSPPVHACWVPPSRATILAAVTSTARLGSSDLLTPGVAKRVTDAVMATMPADAILDQLRADLDADPDLTDDYARKFAGEYGDVAAIRDGMGGLAGPHERDDRWLSLASEDLHPFDAGRPSSDERYGDGRGRGL